LRDVIPVAEIGDLEAVVRGLGWLTPEQATRLDAIAAARWVLVKMDQGEYWKCGRCGGKHSVPDIGPVLTRFCTPRPWRGLAQGLYAYSQHLGARAADLTPSQQERAAILGNGLPTLASRHPLTAAALGTASRDLEIVGWLLGSVVEISLADARRYAARINVRAHRPLIVIEGASHARP
jgi:hypothetical protein